MSVLPFRGIVSAAVYAAVLASLSVACPVMAGDQPGAASDADEATTAAVDHFKKGVQFFDKGKYAAALAEFLKSYELKPAWQLRYNIGICFTETDHPLDAYEHLTLYLEEGGDQVAPERRAEVEQTIEELRGEIGFISLAGGPADSMVTIDDFLALTMPVPDPVPVEAGPHAVTASKPGFVQASMEVLVVPGETKIVEIALEPKEVAPAPIPPPGGGEGGTGPVPGEGKQDKKPAKKPLTGIWVALGAGGGLAVAAAITGGLTLHYKGDMLSAADGCANTESREACPAAYSNQDKAKSTMMATNVFWGLAAAAVVAGIVVFAAGKPHAREEGETPDHEPGAQVVSVAPILEVGEAGSVVGLGAMVVF